MLIGSCSGGNLYIGTSAAEILHYVLIPAGDGPDEKEQFIIATRLPLAAPDGTNATDAQVGVQQILILPNVGKACIVCNGVTTFYTLPELSPVFASTKLGNCSWVGGLDLDESIDESPSSDDVVMMLCQRSKIRLIRVGDRLRSVRGGEIDLGGCSAVARRGNVACIADSRAYSLLDVVEKQQIPLSDIVPPDEKPPSPAVEAGGNGETQSSGDHTLANAQASSLAVPEISETDRSRSISPVVDGKADSSGEFAQSLLPRRESSLQVPRSSSPSSERPSRPTDAQPVTEPNSSTRVDGGTVRQTVKKLQPNIASPTPTEFLFTTGTSMDEPGVGMYVNLDGDVTRGTLEFSRYPEALCTDLWQAGPPITPGGMVPDPDGFVIAVVSRLQGEKKIRSLEIQKWNPDSSDSHTGKHWLDIHDARDDSHEQIGSFGSVGVRSSMSPAELVSPDIAGILGLKRLVLETNTMSGQANEKNTDVRNGADRTKTETQFIARLSLVQAKILVWSGNRVWWASRNPLLVRLDSQLSSAIEEDAKDGRIVLDRQSLQQTLHQVDEHETQTELDFLGFKYIRQRASLLLFTDVVADFLDQKASNDGAVQLAEETLFQSEVDPRIVLAVLPVLRNEIVESRNGIWIPNALKTLIDSVLDTHDLNRSLNPSHPLDAAMLHLAKRFLHLWRRKKGFGSIADEAEVFHSVDAALLHTLLLLDSQSPKGLGTKGSIRSELNTFVDHPVDCGERAVELLESYKRLYVLSRLYQGRKMPAKVLATWRRIIEGEDDAGGQLRDGEQEVSRYLLRISDATVFEEYCTWLAKRNPLLGVRVFADSSSKVRFTPARVVEILKQRAPNAVKDFLEHLVFDKNVSLPRHVLIIIYMLNLCTSCPRTPMISSAIISIYWFQHLLIPVLHETCY